MDAIKELIVKYGPPVVGALLFLFVGYLITGWIAMLLVRALEKAKVERTLSRFFGSVARWGLMVLVVISCLGVFNIQTMSFAAVLGAAGLAIGLAFQGSLGNLASGIMLLIFRPFKVDDVVRVAGEIGKVEGIDLFTTRLDTPDNRRIILPNGTVFGSTIENITFHPTRRVDVSVGVEYKADIDRTREVLTRAAASVPGTLEDPPPQIILLALGDSSVNWQVRVWTEAANYWAVLDAATRAVKVALDDAGIGIPFPQMDVHLDKPVGQA